MAPFSARREGIDDDEKAFLQDDITLNRHPFLK